MEVYITTADEGLAHLCLREHVLNHIRNWLEAPEIEMVCGHEKKIGHTVWRYSGTPTALALNKPNTLTLYVLARLQCKTEKRALFNAVLPFYAMDTGSGRCFKGLILYGFDSESVHKLNIQELLEYGFSIHRQRRNNLLFYKAHVNAIKDEAATGMGMHLSIGMVARLQAIEGGENLVQALTTISSVHTLSELRSKLDACSAGILQVYDILQHPALETELSTIASLLDTAQLKLNMAVRDIGSAPFQKCVEAMAKHANEAQIAVFELEEERCIVGYPTQVNQEPQQAIEGDCVICMGQATPRYTDHNPRDMMNDPWDVRIFSCSVCKAWMHLSCFVTYGSNKRGNSVPCPSCNSNSFTKVYQKLTKAATKKRKHEEIEIEIE